jgi:hypothetical protein
VGVWTTGSAAGAAVSFSLQAQRITLMSRITVISMKAPVCFSLVAKGISLGHIQM